jgi:formamidopyrimidine-DNA glycosylase
VAGIERAGKRVVVRLENQSRIVFEPRMTGLVLVTDPPDRQHLRLQLRLSGTDIAEVRFWDRRGLGSVSLFSSDEFEAACGPGRLGPDALAVTAAQLRNIFRHTARDVKVALLDQRRLAGIGNLYASEILHVARIHPRRRCNQLSLRQWLRLHDAVRHVLQEAIRYEGSTLSDGTYRNALNQTGTYQNHHRVYGRAGQPCASCGRSTIVRFVQAQRATFCCPTCQPAPRTTAK